MFRVNDFNAVAFASGLVVEGEAKKSETTLVWTNLVSKRAKCFIGQAVASLLFAWTVIFKVLSRQRFCFLMTVIGLSLQSVSAVPREIDLAQFYTGAGARFIGPFNSQTGKGLAAIGDHNGDGFLDYVVTTPTLDVAVIVMKKNTTYVELSVPSIVSGQYFRVIKGPTGSLTGSSVGGIGDINGDGFDDVIIGASAGLVPGRTGVPGYAYVIFGTQGPFTDLVVTADWPASFLGFMILGPADQTKFAVEVRIMRGLGDVNGDGLADFAVGAPDIEFSRGFVWVIYDRNTSAFTTIDTLPENFNSSDGIYFRGAASVNRVGYTVMPAGDFNGDGIADFLMGAYSVSSMNGVNRVNAGMVYLIYGSKTDLASTELSTFTTGAKGVRFYGAGSENYLGVSLGGVGDVNDDGIDDIALGAPYANVLGRNYAGIIYVVFGSTVPIATDVDLLSFATASALGFQIYGHTTNVQLGSAVNAGDVNGDGVKDLLVAGTGFSSRAHIIHGQKSVRAAPVDTLTDAAITFLYSPSSARLGFSLEGGQDLNGDGIDDILLSGHDATVTPESGGSNIIASGAAWLLPGPSFVVPRPTATPTLSPSSTPSCVPSAIPSVHPSAVPSFSPSEVPTYTVTPPPSAAPSMDPSARPSEVPSISPSAEPTTAPPTADPSESPTEIPTVNPSMEPTAQPTVDPSASPTEVPSAMPTVSAPPSVEPTSSPFLMPTAAPSTASTARPTVPAVQNFQLVVDVEQDISPLTKADYDAQQAECDLTIQHTVADATGVPAVIPERVTNIIVVEEEEEEEERRRLEEEEERRRLARRDHTLASALATSSVRLKYRVTVLDPEITVNKLRTNLMLAVNSGKMNRDLSVYATQFGATALINGTVSSPQVTNAAVQRDASEQLTGVQIALVVVGVVVGLVLLAAIVWLLFFAGQALPHTAPGDGQVPVDMVL